jgi:hypothetical protein
MTMNNSAHIQSLYLSSVRIDDDRDVFLWGL